MQLLTTRCAPSRNAGLDIHGRRTSSPDLSSPHSSPQRGSAPGTSAAGRVSPTPAPIPGLTSALPFLAERAAANLASPVRGARGAAPPSPLGPAGAAVGRSGAAEGPGGGAGSGGFLSDKTLAKVAAWGTAEEQGGMRADSRGASRAGSAFNSPRATSRAPE